MSVSKEETIKVIEDFNDKTAKKFASIIRGWCFTNFIRKEQLYNKLGVSADLGDKMYSGELPWVGHVTFKQLDEVFYKSRGYTEEVYKNICKLYFLSLE